MTLTHYVGYTVQPSGAMFFIKSKGKWQGEQYQFLTFTFCELKRKTNDRGWRMWRMWRMWTIERVTCTPNMSSILNEPHLSSNVSLGRIVAWPLLFFVIWASDPVANSPFRVRSHVHFIDYSVLAKSFCTQSTNKSASLSMSARAACSLHRKKKRKPFYSSVSLSPIRKEG